MPYQAKRSNKSSRKPKTQFQKVNRSPIWVDLKTRRLSEIKEEGYTYFASRLEYQVWVSFTRKLPVLIPQYPLLLLPETERAEAIYLNVDFWIPTHSLAVEVKGKWILNKANSAEKALFKFKWNLVQRLGINSVIVSDTDFKLSNYTVHNHYDYLRIL